MNLLFILGISWSGDDQVRNCTFILMRVSSMHHFHCGKTIYEMNFVCMRVCTCHTHVCELMDGWMDEWIRGYVGERMDRLIGYRWDGYMGDGYMDG